MTANSVVKNLSRDNKNAGINEYKTLFLRQRRHLIMIERISQVVRDQFLNVLFSC
jgi:hypothetical protein